MKPVVRISAALLQRLRSASIRLAVGLHELLQRPSSERLRLPLEVPLWMHRAVLLRLHPEDRLPTPPVARRWEPPSDLQEFWSHNWARSRLSLEVHLAVVAAVPGVALINADVVDAATTANSSGKLRLRLLRRAQDDKIAHA